MITNLTLASIISTQWKLLNYFFMPVTKPPHLTILLFCKRRPFQIFAQFRGFSKETNSKNCIFHIEKEMERKDKMVKTAKYCHLVTWTQKSVTNKRERQLE